MRILKYSLKFSVAEVARILKVDKSLIKTWAYKFSAYLTQNANPEKGKPREFLLEDIRVMAYILLYWEVDPDVESISIGLNDNSHHEHDLINDLVIEITPIFIDPPDHIDETWKHGIVFNGLSKSGDTFFLANSYKLAGDRLIGSALENEEGLDLFCPVIYNYRHATELYLKTIIGNYKQSHDLSYLFNKLKELLKKEFNTSVPEWFENIIAALNDFDPGGTTFRYGGSLKKDEIFIDFIQLKTLMNWLSSLPNRSRNCNAIRSTWNKNKTQ